MADRLSRVKSTTDQDRKLLRNFTPLNIPVSFSNWMKEPVEDWNLARNVVFELSNNFSLPE